LVEIVFDLAPTEKSRGACDGPRQISSIEQFSETVVRSSQQSNRESLRARPHLAPSSSFLTTRVHAAALLLNPDAVFQ